MLNEKKKDWIERENIIRYAQTCTSVFIAACSSACFSY